MKENTILTVPFYYEFVKPNIIEVVSKRFPKLVHIQETELSYISSFKDALLFKRDFFNEYCLLVLSLEKKLPSITFFKCDFSDFEKIESYIMEGCTFTFTINNIDELKIIINNLY